MPAPAIETSGLTKRFGDLTALDDLTITVETGRGLRVPRPERRGKTTTIRLLLGLARAVGRLGPHLRARQLGRHRCGPPPAGLRPGEFNAWRTLRGDEMLDLLGSVHGGYDPKVRDELCERFEFDPSKKGQGYSKGNRQKIALIAALMVQPDLLVLDEPTSGLDPLMEVTFRHCVAEAHDRGQTVFLSSHILSRGRGRLRSRRHAPPRPPGRGEHARGSASTQHAGGGGRVRRRAGSRPGRGGRGRAGVGRGAHGQVPAPGRAVAAAAQLAPHDVASIDIREPSLEELFLTFYGGDVDESLPELAPEPEPEPRAGQAT